MSDQIDYEWARLPEPEPPAAFGRAVMARLSRMADERALHPLASPASMRSRGGERLTHWIDLAAGAAALAGLAIVLVSWIDAQAEAGWSLELWSRQLGTPGMMMLPQSGSVVWALAVGLVLYLAGTFAPLRGERSRHDRA